MLSTQLYHGLRVLAPRIHTLTGINDFFRRAARQVRLIDRKNYHATTAALLRKSFSSSSTHSRTENTGSVREYEDMAVEDLEDFGDYEIILPPDPPIFGTLHITPRSVPKHILRPPYAYGVLGGAGRSQRNERDLDPFYSDPYEGDGKIEPGSLEETQLRQAAALAQKVLSRAQELVKVGTTTNEIDARLHEFILSNGAYPSPLLYAGFPRSCCTSVNNIVVHGIPDDRALQNGDIVNIDVTVYFNGFHGDTSQTFLVGNVDFEGRQLVRAVNEALEAGIGVCGPGVLFKDVGDAITRVADKYDLCISSQFSGHGIGKVFHRPPWVLHQRNDEPGTMQPGHCFTIEVRLAFVSPVFVQKLK